MFDPSRYVRPNVSKDDAIALKKAFDSIDVDHNNAISPLEIRAFFQRVELQDSKDSIYEMLKEMDEDYSGGVDFDEYFGFLTAIFEARDKRDELRKVLKKGVDLSSKIQPQVPAKSQPVQPPKQDTLKAPPANQATNQAKKGGEASLSREKQKKEVLRSKAKTGSPSKREENNPNVSEGFNPEPYITPNASKETVLDLKKAFDILDVDGSGVVSPTEITKYFETLGLMSKNKFIYQILAEMDENNSGGIDFEEFVKFITSRISDRDSNLKDEIARIFAFFDANGNGKVSWNELKVVAQFLGEEMTDDEIKEMFLKADLDDDGFVTVEDFYNIWTGKGYY